MGLVLSVIFGVATLVWAFIILLADSMSDAPGQGMSVWPTLLIGGAVTAALVFSHYHPFTW